MAPLSEQEMNKWRRVAIKNVILGLIVAIVQVVTLFTLYEWVDWIGIGIWGGCFMMSAGILTLQRNPRLISMSICAMLSGLALIIFYAWNLGVYNNYSSYYGFITTGLEAYCYYYGYNDQLCDWRLAADIIFIFYAWNLGVYNNYSYYGNSGLITTGPEAYCYYYNYNHDLCDWRFTSDIIFIVCGSLALIFNLFLTMNAKEIVIVQPIVRYPVNNVYGTTNTTYMATSNQHPAGYQQTVYQVHVVTYPSNNTNNGVIYQTSPPGYPPVNNNQQQQQPVYYIQTNPPAYSATANN